MIFLSVGGSDTNDGFSTSILDTTIYLSGLDNPPSVVTTSYGDKEEDYGISFATCVISLRFHP